MKNKKEEKEKKIIENHCIKIADRKKKGKNNGDT